MCDQLFTADLHLGHDPVARLRGFDTTEEHDAFILEGLRSTVRKQDILWVLGDYSVGDHGLARAMLNTIPGRKNLIPGNHDPEHPMHRSAWKKQRLSLGTFEAVLPFARVRLQRINFLLNHLPYDGDHEDEDRHTQYRLRDEGAPLLCGHVHEAWKFNGNQFNVGVDVNDFKPVPTGQVLDWYATIAST